MKIINRLEYIQNKQRMINRAKAASLNDEINTVNEESTDSINCDACGGDITDDSIFIIHGSILCVPCRGQTLALKENKRRE